MNAPRIPQSTRSWLLRLGVASLVSLGCNAAGCDGQAGRESALERGEQPGPSEFAAEPGPSEAQGELQALPVAELAEVAEVSSGGVLAIDRHGLLVVERSAGELVRASRSGERLAATKLSPGLGELVTDGAGVAFVADRGANRILRFDVDHAEAPRELGSAAVFEPHGLALTPDRATLLATSVSEHALVALDAQTLAPRWEVELGPEPRAVAVAGDGSYAAVAFLSSGSLAFVDLASEGQRVQWHSLEPRDHLEIKREQFESDWGDEMETVTFAQIVEARSRFSVPVETGRRYVRGIFALQFMTDGRLFAPHQLATPQLKRVVARRSADSYGGESASEIRAIEHQLAVVSGVGALAPSSHSLRVQVQQPRALAYDPGKDRLFVAGYGDDAIVRFDEASSPRPQFADSDRLRLAGGQACGIDGLALDDAEHGGALWIHCEFGRKLVRLDVSESMGRKDQRWLEGESLAESARSAEAEQGAALFSRNDFRLSDNGNLACTSCHPEGRSDGLTWRLGASILQAPVLAGRVRGTSPYKWDGQDPTIQASVRHTTRRLGGEPESVSTAEYDALIAYLEQLPPPKPRQRGDARAIERGREVFTGTSCDACHEGPLTTDQAQHELDTTLARVDTPSLIALAHSRPFFHDGSAPDLRTLLTDRGTIHDMADTSALSDAQLGDLVTYLESL